LNSDSLSNSIPPRGRLLGVDYGTVRVGLAVSDPDRIISSPFTTYTRRSTDLDAEYFRTLVQSERIVGFVVGLAMHSGGEEGIKARECREYGAWLVETTGLPLAMWDERFTSSLAQDAMIGAGLTSRKRKERIDRVAAQLILQGYLEAHASLRKKTGTFET
jgi:putative Holliday junction resolvase